MKDNKGERKDGLIASQGQNHKKFRKQIWDETICVLLKVRLRRDCHQDKHGQIYRAHQLASLWIAWWAPGQVTDHRGSFYSGAKRIWAKLQPWAVTSIGQSLSGAYLKTFLLSLSYLFCKSNHYGKKKKTRQSNSCPPFNNLEIWTCQTRKIHLPQYKGIGCCPH